MFGDAERSDGFLGVLATLYMTGAGRYDPQTDGMDLIESTRIIQADREREIEAAARDRRLLSPEGAPEPDGWRERWLRRARTPQRSVSSATLSR